jgi:putative peptidoglycan lipid II flippase
MVLAGSTVGLFATTQSRLFSSAFYAMHDTKTPLKFALIRVALSSTLGYCASQYAPYFLHINTLYGTVGITVASGLSGWVEYRDATIHLIKSCWQSHLGKVI